MNCSQNGDKITVQGRLRENAACGKVCNMKKKKVLWLLTMAGLCIIIYTIVLSRMDHKTEVIFGGVDGAYISTDKYSLIDPSSLETPVPTENIWPDIDITMGQYAIVNSENLLASAYEPEVDRISITQYQQFEVTALPYLEEMIADLQEAGFSVWVGGSYRTYSYQYQLFNSKASQIAYGYGVTDYNDPLYQKAAEEAKLITAFPGGSEHQLGLAVDLFDRSYSYLNYEDMNQDFYAWLDENCAKYGFIKRYPTRKLLLTGWDEPWHYRYVGVEAATFIMEHGLCYEEFYQHYVPDFEY